LDHAGVKKKRSKTKNSGEKVFSFYCTRGVLMEFWTATKEFLESIKEYLPYTINASYWVADCLLGITHA